MKLIPNLGKLLRNDKIPEHDLAEGLFKSPGQSSPPDPVSRTTKGLRNLFSSANAAARTTFARPTGMCLLLAGTLGPTESSAQTERSHKLTSSVILEECDHTGSPVRPAIHQLVPAGSKFSIYTTTNDSYVIRFWNWTVKSEPLSSARAKGVASTDLTAREKHALHQQSQRDRLNFKDESDTTIDAYRFFLLPKTTLGSLTEVVLSRIDPMVGTVVLPFKIRPQNGDFAKDITISGMVGAKWRPNRSDNFTLGLVFGAGIASVTLDSMNTDGRITEVSDRAAITLSTGLVVQWKRVQVAGLIGWDHLGKTDKKLWSHNGAHWLGLGVGVAIFSEDSGAKEEGGN